MQLTGLRSTHQVEKTRHASDSPWIVGLENLSKDEGHHAQLHYAAYCCRDKRAADAKAESGGEDAIEEDEGEGEPDVGPGEMC